jgi:hypothetical protein
MFGSDRGRGVRRQLKMWKRKTKKKKKTDLKGQELRHGDLVAQLALDSSSTEAVEENGDGDDVPQNIQKSAPFAAWMCLTPLLVIN